MRVMLAGGGTAGHIQPALATAHELRRRFPQAELCFLGTASGLETRLIPESGYELRLIPRTPLPRRITPALFGFPMKLLASVKAARSALRGATCLIGFGGYVAAPAYLAARSLAIPIVIHEQNAKAGFANRLGARLTPFVGVTFANTRLPHAKVVGMPLHPRIVAAAQVSKATALAHFELPPERPVLLVTGGSQGSQRINTALAGSLDALIDQGWQILHAVGEKNAMPAKRDHYRALPYIEEMGLALRAADLLVGRSGAVTCAEAAALRLPAIFVPLPIGNGEQALNAMDAVRAGGAILCTDSELTAERLTALVANLRPRLSEMSTSLASVGSTTASTLLVDLVEQSL